MAQTTTPEQAEVPEQQELVRRGQALPVLDGAPWPDAPQGQIGVGCNESTATYLALQPGSPESRMSAHVGGHHIGAVAPIEEQPRSEAGTWPRTHAALDQLEDNNVALPESATTVDAKIEELQLMGVKPPKV